MTEGSYSLSEESMRLAEEGVLLIVSATYGVAIASFVIMEAALDVLAASAGSSSMRSSSTEHDADVEGLLPVLCVSPRWPAAY